MSEQDVIEISHLNKVYKIFERPVDRIKESLSPFHKRYSRDFYAIRDLSLSIKKGETIGIVGKNGAGKSTLLKIITGVLTPTEGEVKVHGRIASLLELGAGFNPEMSGIENIYMNGDIMGVSREAMEKRVDDIVAFADIGEFIRQPVKTYSSGMFARLAFAVNAFVEPDILIVDEALSVGDIGFQSKCFRKFREMRKQGITILLVTHEMDAVLNYCSQAVLMEHGSVTMTGDPREVVDVYKKHLAIEASRAIAEKQTWVDGQESGPSVSDVSGIVGTRDGSVWREQLHLNKDYLEYGDKDFEFVDYAVLNEAGEITSLVTNAEQVTLRVKVRVNRPVAAPIFAFNVKTPKGTEVLGSNTLLMHTELGEFQLGQMVIVSFRAPISVRAGQYLLSFGCTEYVNEGLRVHHRLYDVAHLGVVAAGCGTNGIADVQPQISVQKY